MMPDTLEVDAIFGRIESYRDDLITRQIVSFGAHTRPELAFLLSVVRPGDAVFDIGGHIGTFALPLAQKVGPSGRVLVVEGSPATYEVLCRNIERLQLGGVLFPVRALIGDAAERYERRPHERNSGASFFAPTDALDGVAGFGLDGFVDSHFSPRVVKIDIEGLEVVALRRAPRLLALNPILYAEVAGNQLLRYGATAEEFGQLLAEHGYRLFRNVGDRNARHDVFVVRELPRLTDGGDFFDVLAVHRDDPRLPEVVACLG